MKKIFKIFLIIAIALMVVGVGIIGVTFVASGFDLDKFTVDERDLTEYSLDVEGKGVDTLVLSDLEEFTAWYEINVIPSEDEDFHIVYSTFNSEQIDWTVKDGTLSLFDNRQNRPDDWRNYIGFFDLDSVPMTIAVPKTLKSMDLRNDVGNVVFKDLQLEGDLFYYGDTDVVMMSQVDIKGVLHLESDATSFTLNNVNAGSIVADVDYGYLNFESVHADNIDVQTDAGDFEFFALSVDESLRILSDYGNISGSIRDAQSSFTIMSQVDIGTSNLVSGGSGKKFLDVRNDTGNIDITFMK